MLFPRGSLLPETRTRILSIRGMGTLFWTSLCLEDLNNLPPDPPDCRALSWQFPKRRQGDKPGRSQPEGEGGCGSAPLPLTSPPPASHRSQAQPTARQRQERAEMLRRPRASGRLEAGPCPGEGWCAQGRAQRGAASASARLRAAGPTASSGSAWHRLFLCSEKERAGQRQRGEGEAISEGRRHSVVLPAAGAQPEGAGWEAHLG